MTGRKSTRLQVQAAEPIPAAVEEPRKGLKRKTPVSKNGDEPLQKATKARRLGKAKVKPDVQGSIPKTRAESKQTGQSYVPANPSLGRISYLPPEVMNMIIDDKTCLKNLTMTSKALYSLAMPQLFKRIERSCGLHVHIAKLIKTTEPFLSIEQRKQLKKEGIYKGQQETFPHDVDPDKKPEISNYVRQILVETGDPGKKHRYIVYRYVEELLENLDNLELWGSWMLTESMAKRLAAQRHLKALWLHVNIPISDDFHSADAIGTLKNLQHLSYYKDAFWGRKGWNKSSPELLIWNSRSTLRSLELNASTFHYMHFQWEESGDEPPRPGYLSALRSFSLVDGEFDDEQTDAIVHAIDFVKLEELSLGQSNTRVGLLYRRLIDAFSAAREGDIKLQSLSMNLQEDADDGTEFLSCFDTLTRLTICNNGINPGETQNPIPEESLWQALYMHKNLTILKLTDDICSAHDTMPGLDAQTAAKFIINFPNLRHLHFYLHESKLEAVAEALSHAKNLKKVCAKTHRWQGAYQEKQIVALRFLQSLVLPVLARASGEGSFIWEEHSKIKHVVCDVFKFEVGSKFGYVKGAKKAQKIESPWNKKHQVLFRFVPLEQTFVKGGIYTMRKWADKVARDLN